MWNDSSIDKKEDANARQSWEDPESSYGFLVDADPPFQAPKKSVKVKEVLGTEKPDGVA